MSKFKENLVSLLLLQGVNYVLPLLTFPYLVRVLGIEGFGKYSVFFSIAQVLFIIVDYGFNFTATKAVALARTDKKAIGVLFGTVYCLKLIIFFCCAVVLFVVAYFKNYELVLPFAALLMTLGNAIYPLWLFQGMELMRSSTYLNLAAKGIVTVSIFCFVHDESHVGRALMIQAIGFLFIGIFGTLWLLKTLQLTGFVRLDRHAFGVQLKQGGAVFWSSIAGAIFGNGAVIILGNFGSSTLAGYYAVAQKIEAAAVGLFQPLAQASYPRLCEFFVNDKLQFRIWERRILLVGLIGATVIASVIFILAPQLSVFFAKTHDAAQLFAIQIFALMTFFTAINVLLNSIILAKGLHAALVKIYSSCAAIFCVAAIPLVKSYSLSGILYLMVLMGATLLTLGFITSGHSKK